ncbi:MAG: hypothetical protein OXH84_09285 [Gammaproteobacteria bacterium]|nr:hypothetical protein [Gammaproteobacteria bacterium]
MFARSKYAFVTVCFIWIVFGLMSVVAEEEVVEQEEAITDEEENVENTAILNVDDLEVETGSDSAVIEVPPDEESSTKTTDESELDADETKDEITDVFTPSESVSEDNPVAFPRDI